MSESLCHQLVNAVVFLLPWQNATFITSCHTRGILASKSVAEQPQTAWNDIMTGPTDPKCWNYKVLTPQIRWPQSSSSLYLNLKLIVVSSGLFHPVFVGGSRCLDWKPKRPERYKDKLTLRANLASLDQMWQLLTFSLWGQSPTQLSDVSDTDSAPNHVNPSSGDPPPSGPSTPGRTEESRQQAQSHAEPQARSAVDAPAAASQRLPSNSNTAKVAGGLEVCMPKV